MSGKPSFGRYTRKQCVDFIRMKLRSDDEWMYRGMKRVYSFQTPDERASDETIHHNLRGFTIADGLLSEVCRKGKTLDTMTNAEKAIARNKMKKYASQLFSFAVDVLHTKELLFAHMDRYYKDKEADHV